MIIVSARTMSPNPMSWGVTVLRTRMFIAPAAPPSAPLTTNPTSRYRRTLIPTDAASSGSSRTASTRRPVRPISDTATSARSTSVTTMM
jgi:hypothetical protein